MSRQGQGTVPAARLPVLVPPAAGATAPIPWPEDFRKALAETRAAIVKGSVVWRWVHSTDGLSGSLAEFIRFSPSVSLRTCRGSIRLGCCHLLGQI